MGAAGYMTIIVALLIIAIAAAGLIRVIVHLRAVLRALRATTAGVRAVADLTAPVPGRLAAVNANLQPVRDFCEGV